MWRSGRNALNIEKNNLKKICDLLKTLFFQKIKIILIINIHLLFLSIADLCPLRGLDAKIKWMLWGLSALISRLRS
jgi:hypothetical protein